MKSLKSANTDRHICCLSKFIAFYSVGLAVDIKSAVRADIFEDDRAATIYCKREHTTAEA